MRKLILIVLPLIVLCSSAVTGLSNDRKQRKGEPWEKYLTDKKYDKWQYNLPNEFADSINYALGMYVATQYYELATSGHYDLEKLLDDFTPSKFKAGCKAFERGLTPREDVINLEIMLDSGVRWEATVSGEGIKERPLMSGPVRKLKTPGEMLAFICGYSGAYAVSLLEEGGAYGIDCRPEMLFYGAFAYLIPVEWNCMMTVLEMDSLLRRSIHDDNDDNDVDDADDEESILAENAGREGVVVLPSGLQYKVIREGEGRSPGLYDEVEIMQSTVLLSDYDAFEEGEGEMFSSSGQVAEYIDGLQEALQLMSVGARYVLWLPSELCSGWDGRVIEVEMTGINWEEEGSSHDEEEDTDGPLWAESVYLKLVASQPGVMETPSGLLYKEIWPGYGDTPGPCDEVSIKELTVLIEDTEGEVFVEAETWEYSFDNGNVSDYIPGVSEALQLMTVGSRYIFWVPSGLCGEGRDGRYLDIYLLDIIPQRTENCD